MTGKRSDTGVVAIDYQDPEEPSPPPALRCTSRGCSLSFQLLLSLHAALPVPGHAGDAECSHATHPLTSQVHPALPLAKNFFWVALWVQEHKPYCEGEVWMSFLKKKMSYKRPKTNSVYSVSDLYLFSCCCLTRMEVWSLCCVVLFSEANLILTQE